MVRSGETLSEIAEHYGMGLSRLRAANGLRGSRLKVGQRLVIPATARAISGETRAEASEKTYRVRSGDTLSSIAQKHGTTIRELKRVNGLKSNALRAGAILKLP